MIIFIIHVIVTFTRQEKCSKCALKTKELSFHKTALIQRPLFKVFQSI